MKKDSSLLALALALPLMGHPLVSIAQSDSDQQQMEQQDSSTQSGSDQRAMDPQDMDPHQQQPYPEEDTMDQGGSGMEEDMGGALDDTTVTNRVRSAISQENSLKFARINVETRSGVVYLSGMVNSEAEAKKAVEVVQGIDGVQSVKHDLKTKR